MFLIHRRYRLERRKRRAKRTVSGAKKEIVVLASTSHDPLARSLALDLDRRGYIVYVTVSSQAECDMLERGPDARADVRPLWMDLTSSVPSPAKNVHPNLSPIQDLISRPQTHQRPGFPNQQYLCTLAGLILMPATDYARTPLTSHPTHDLVDTVNTRLLSPIVTIQQFLPLLSRLNNPTSIIVAYPSIPSSLNPPLQIASSATTAALSSMARALRSELALLQPSSAQPIQITELKLGNIDLGTTPAFSKSDNADTLESLSQSHSPSPSRQQQALPWHWHSSQRAQALRRSFGQAATSSVRGSPARVFHNAVFDTLFAARSSKPPAERSWPRAIWDNVAALSESGPGGTVYTGRGAWIYNMLSVTVPSHLIQSVIRWRCRREGWGADHPDVEAGQGRSTTHYGGRASSGSPNRLEGSAGSESAVWEKV